MTNPAPSVRQSCLHFGVNLVMAPPRLIYHATAYTLTQTASLVYKTATAPFSCVHRASNAAYELFYGNTPVSEPSFTAPTLDELEQNHHAIIEAPVQAQEPVNHSEQDRNLALEKELKTFTASLRRMLEAQFILSGEISTELKNAIGGTEADFYNAFKKQAQNQVQISSLPAFLRPVYYAFLLTLHFFLKQFTYFIFNQVESFLDAKIKDFKNADKQKIMDLITNILCEGFHTYTSEIINICHELNTSTQVDGSVQEMLEKRLSQKLSLHNKMSEQKFYLHALDQILKHCFNLSITRYVLKKLIEYSGFLKNPFLSLPQAIKTNNGYFHEIDKAVVKLITPIINNMKKPQTATRAVSNNGGVQPEQKTFTNYSKDKLKQAISSLFEAADVNKAANLSEIKKIANRAKQSTFLDTMGLNFDAILKQTAEAGAQSLLENVAEVLTPEFLQDNAINALKALNQVFKATDAVTEQQYKTAERERKDILNLLTQVIIENAVETTPILNKEAILKKLNHEITDTKEIASSIFTTLKTYMRSANAAIYPHQIITESIARLETLKTKLDATANSIDFSKEQKAALNAPYDQIKFFIREFQDAYKPGIGHSTRRANAALSKFEKMIKSPLFAHRHEFDVLNNSFIKKMAKLAVNMILTHKFNEAYEFICDFKTIKYCVIHQGVLARV